MSVILHYFAAKKKKKKKKENETDKEKGTYGGDEEFVEGFLGETKRKYTT
jgi:hypothetical protein